MLADIPKQFRKYSKHCQSLKRILKDTRCALEDISNILQLGKELKEEFINQDIVDKLQKKLERVPTLLVSGQNCHAKALFVNSLLDQVILPLFSARWRHITFKYGLSKNVHFTWDNEYEIVENLKAHEKPWITIPEEDLQRNGEENCASLEVELCHPLLKENVKIMVPPDCYPEYLDDLLKRNLENVVPVIIYAVSEPVLSDKVGIWKDQSEFAAS